MTAEVDPLPAGQDQSASNRTLKVHLQAGDVDKTRLAVIQSRGRPWLAMRAYIEWLMAGDRTARIVARRNELIAWLRGVDGIQVRAPEIVANLAVAFSALCEFAASHGVLSEEHARVHSERCLATLTDLMQDQHEVSTATAPEAVYLDTLKSLVSQGRAPLLPVDRRLDSDLTGTARPIGWRDSRHVFLDPTLTHEAVVTATRASGQHVGMTMAAIYERWVERGWASARTDPTRIGVQRSLGGSRPRVIEMPVSLFDDVPAPGPRSTDVTVEIDEQALVAAFEPADLPN